MRQGSSRSHPVVWQPDLIPDLDRTRSDVLPNLVDKCLGSTRAGTKRAAIELAMLYIEVENTGEGVIVGDQDVPSHAWR